MFDAGSRKWLQKEQRAKNQEPRSKTKDIRQ